MDAVSRGTLLSMLGSDFSDFVELPAIGASGGILIAWRHGLGQARATRVDQYSVSIEFSPSGLQLWWLTCVYGPQGDDNKLLFLQELRNFCSCKNSETLGLDRALCSAESEQLFPNCLLRSEATDGSDHCPLLLGMNVIQPSKARFHFEAFWTKLDGFQEAVESAWASEATSSCPFDTLA